ncbi:hypothetical protein ANN_19347 [Periplaneta americana]|uniref:PiggyBac transposable element-derived protein 4 n=1 Tax=Periplaneta americana TaxID=6978 RepID=A0ABQ8SA45_PERAM|nr:hypothetical protein ANN_19347 [Periplaneta americana]
MAIRWKDKKDVVLLSTIHNPEMVMKNNELKPKVVIDYNDTMGGVDRIDHHLAAYPGGRDSPLEYRISVIRKMFEKCCPSVVAPKVGRPGKTPHPLRLTERHFPELLPPTQKKNAPTRKCAMCSRVRDAKGKKIRRESRYCCPDCDVALSVTPCFRVYHTTLNI